MRSKTKAVLLTLLVATTPSFAAEPGGPPAKSREDLAREMIRLTGGEDLAKQMIEQMIEMFKQQDQGIPAEFWTEFQASIDTSRLTEMTVPIYVEHLTVDEMTAAIDFYSSPAGRSLVKKLPAIMQQSMSEGQIWGEELAREVIERLAKYKQLHPEA